MFSGQISQYDIPPEDKYGVRNLFHVVAKRFAKIRKTILLMGFD